MKRTIIVMGVAALAGLVNYAIADEQGTGHTTEVTPGDWDDDDPILNFNFLDIPTAKYTGLQLHLNCSLKEAKILYTTDTTATQTDEAAWTEYTGPLDLSENCTIRFFARCEGYNDSDIQTYIFVYADHQAIAPVIAPDMDKTRLMMTSETPGATIRYTTDGSDPDASGTLYEGPVELTENCIFRAQSFADEMFQSEISEYVVDFLTAGLPEPSFKDRALVLTPSDPSESIYFTTDTEASADNTEAWTLYTAPLSLTEDCTVRFFGRKKGLNDSEIGSFSFVYTQYQTAAPQLSTDPEGTLVVMECETEGAEIRYTTDGSDPTLESWLYNGPVEIVSNGIFRARAFADGLFDSNVTVFTIMHLAVPTPLASFEDKKLQLSCPDSNAAIWYTTDSNATPDYVDAWTEYKAPIKLTEDCTVRFFGRRDGLNDSDIQSFSFVYTAYQAQAPVISRNAQGTHITIKSFVDGGQIRYTTDGTIPTASSALYQNPIRIEKGATYHARVFADNMFESEVAEYTIGNDQLSVPTAEFADYAVVLSSPDADARIWYTHDHELSVDNIDAWILYTQPIQMMEDGIIRFFAGDDDANASDVQMFVYQRSDYQVEAPVIMRTDDERSLIMTVSLEGAEIRYTTDGSDPTRESELYTEPIFLTSNCTYKAVAFADGLYDSAVSEFTVSNLTMMMPAAACEHNTLILTVWDEMASIWYTTDPDAPHEDMDAWTLYTEPVVLTQDCTVRFFARRSGFLDSPIATYDFVKEDPTGVDTVGSAGLGVRKEAGKVVVYSDRAASVPVYTLDGKIVKVVNVVAGRNVINGLDSNVYIIGNVRIKI